jgi:hypothetical protein
MLPSTWERRQRIHGLSAHSIEKMNSRQGLCCEGYSNGDHALHSATLSGEANRAPVL